MAVELLKKGAYPCERAVFKKKDSKFDADLVLGVEDGKARFSLEFPKRKQTATKRKNKELTEGGIRLWLDWKI